jgi:EVE domain
MAHYLFNFATRGTAKGRAREQAAGLLRFRMWGIRADETHRDALAPGDLVLIYVGGQVREFIGRAELVSAVRDWTASEARLYPGDSPSGVLLSQVEEWNPPVPVNAVLSQIDPAENARGDFQAGVVRITLREYQTVLAVSAGRLPTTG